MKQRFVVFVAAVGIAGCAGSKDGKPKHGGPGREKSAVRSEGLQSAGGVGSASRPVKSKALSSKEVGHMNVTSSAFAEGKPIPKKYAYRGEGQNISPPLAWSGAPEGTKSFVVIAEDPDAPSPKHPRPKPWVHWVLYDIPASVTSLAEGRAAGTQGRNDFGETAYGGPMPPVGSGVHRYFFKVYALDSRLNLAVGATRDQVLAAIKGHVLAEGALYGTYSR